MADSPVIRALHGAKGKYREYTPFILSMIDRDGTIQTLPYPSQQGEDSGDTIYGVEMMVNPASISNNMSKIINRTQTMTSFVEEVWGEELDTITFQGSTAAFVTGGTDVYTTRLHDSGTSPILNYLQRTNQELFNTLGLGGMGSANSGVRDEEPGLTVSQRRSSVSYRQFLRLIDLFRANGCLFNSQGFVQERYYIWLSFGSSAYRGLFESIDVTEDASNPYRFIYTVTFKSEETVFSYTDPGLTWGSVV